MSEVRTTPGSDASFANFGEVLPSGLDFDKFYWMSTEHYNEETEAWQEQIDMVKVLKSPIISGGKEVELTVKVMGVEKTVTKTSPRTNEKLIWVIGHHQTASQNVFQIKSLAKCKFFGPITCQPKGE